METPSSPQHNRTLAPLATPDPAWSYYSVWVKATQGLQALTNAITYISQQELSSTVTDAEIVDRLTKALTLVEMARGLLVDQPAQLQQDEYTRSHHQNQ